MAYVYQFINDFAQIRWCPLWFGDPHNQEKYMVDVACPNVCLHLQGDAVHAGYVLLDGVCGMLWTAVVHPSTIPFTSTEIKKLGA